MYTLITHPDLKNQSTKNEKILIGEWCKKNFGENFSGKILSYDVRKNNGSKDDYEYLESLQDKILKKISDSLNTIHSKNYDTKYWKIAIGPYLLFMCHVLFERWNLIKHAKKNYNIKEAYVIKYYEETLATSDTKEVGRLAHNDHNWNHMIYSEILKYFSDVKLIEVGSIKNLKEEKVSIKINSNKYLKYLKFIIKNSLKDTYNKILKKVLKDITIYYLKFLSIIKKNFSLPFIFIDEAFPTNIQLSLYLKNNSFPWNFTYISKNSFSKNKVNLQLRKKFSNNLNLEEFSDFEKCTLKIIYKLIPTSFLEDYEDTLKELNRSKYSFFCNNIILKTLDVHTDFTKIFVAEKKIKGSSIITYQWVANAGLFKDEFNENHDRKISDKYLTFGWKDNEDKKVYPVGFFFLPKLKKINKNDNLLLLTYRLENYSLFYESSSPISTIWIDYLNDVFNFYENLNEKIKGKVIARWRSSIHDNFQKERWIDKFPQIKIDLQSDFNTLICKQKLCVSTYLGSNTYKTTLALNIPTIILFNRNLFKFRKSAERYLNNLEEAGILHYSSDTAATKVNSEWEKIDEWWNSPKTQNARKEFVENFYKTEIDVLNLFNLFKKS